MGKTRGGDLNIPQEGSFVPFVWNIELYYFLNFSKYLVPIVVPGPSRLKLVHVPYLCFLISGAGFKTQKKDITIMNESP